MVTKTKGKKTPLASFIALVKKLYFRLDFGLNLMVPKRKNVYFENKEKLLFAFPEEQALKSLCFKSFPSTTTHLELLS